MSSKRAIKRNRERVLAKRKRQIHANEDDEGMQVIEQKVLEFQEQYRSGSSEDFDYYIHVMTTLQLLESMHREVMKDSRCDVCLDDFKQQKFYMFDELGYEFNAYGIAQRREALAS
jgi:hypothetical protein